MNRLKAIAKLPLRGRISASRAMSLLLPGGAEEDERFRHELLILSRLSLRVIGMLEMVVPILVLPIWLIVMSAPASNASWILETLSLVAVGALTSGIARTRWSRSHPRMLVGFSAWLVATILISSSGQHLMAARVFGVDHYIPAYVTLIMLVTVATVPFRPLHTLLLGLAIEVVNFASAPPDSVPEYSQHVFVLILVLLATVLTAVIYSERLVSYRAHQQLLTATRRTVLSESAASLGRVVAGLSHEFNSPLGALASGVDTLVELTARRATLPLDKSARLEPVQKNLQHSLKEATARIQQVVARMQRFANLDRAEVRPTDVNELLKDVVALHEAAPGRNVRLALDLEPLPVFLCRPQQLSAVFYNLVLNAVEAARINEQILVQTRRLDGEIEVRIKDHGQGIPAEQLAELFNPHFKTSGGRVGTGNWSLFSCRQIVQEHGGEIQVESVQGEGTTATVILPAEVQGLEAG